MKVYARRTTVDDITTLCARKIEAGRNLAKGMLARTWAELESQLDVILITIVLGACRFKEQVEQPSISIRFGYRVRNFEIGTRLPGHTRLCSYVRTLKARPPKYCGC